jgi:hypothetical protein
VVQHLCDCNASLGGTDQRLLDPAAGFDPRTTPRHWPAILASEPPDASLARFLGTTRDLLALARSWLDRGERYQVRLPYGAMDWTVLVLHGFWDSWLHERDILLAQPGQAEQDQRVYGEGDQDPDRSRQSRRVGKANEAGTHGFLSRREDREQRPRRSGR